VPATTSHLPFLTAAGQLPPAVVRDGEIRLRLPQLPGRVFRLYCLFSEAMKPTNPPLLGLNDFLDVFRVTLDGRFSRDAPAGHMLFETD
jgi:hypothetical protein